MNWKDILIGTILTSMTIAIIVLLQKDTNTSDLTQEQKKENLSRLAPYIQLEYIKQYFGEPIMIETLDSADVTNRKAYTFIDRDFYLWVVTDKDNALLSYTVTTRSQTFNPTLRIRGVEVTLGKSSFSLENNSKPTRCIGERGNTSISYYLEEYDGWNGTGYMDYLLGYNDAGSGDASELITRSAGDYVENSLESAEVLKDDNTTNQSSCHENLDDLRKTTIINTFGVGNEELAIGVNRRVVDRISFP